LIAQEAGAQVTTFKGEQISLAGKETVDVLAATATLHQELGQALATAEG